MGWNWIEAPRRHTHGLDSHSIGVGKSCGSPRPPNRTGGFPACGSPVGGFLIGSVSRRAVLFAARAARLARRRHWASVDGPRDGARTLGAFAACAASRADVGG